MTGPAPVDGRRGDDGPRNDSGPQDDGRGRNDRPPTDDGRRGEDGAKTFEQLLAELEDVTDRLAGGELGIEAAADLYERAEQLHGLASARLAQVQERVDRLRANGPRLSP